MATIATNRAAFQRVNPNLRIGKSKRPYLTTSEQANLRKAISALQKSVDATDENTAMVNLSAAFQTIRKTILDNR